MGRRFRLGQVRKNYEEKEAEKTQRTEKVLSTSVADAAILVHTLVYTVPVVLIHRGNLF